MSQVKKSSDATCDSPRRRTTSTSTPLVTVPLLTRPNPHFSANPMPQSIVADDAVWQCASHLTQ